MIRRGSTNNRHRWTKMMKQRLDKDPSYFEQIQLSDEFKLKFQQCRSTYLRGHRGIRFSDRYIQEKKKYDPSTELIV
jgi:hypothetical protein